MVLDMLIGKDGLGMSKKIQVDVELFRPVGEFAVQEICHITKGWCTKEAETQNEANGFYNPIAGGERYDEADDTQNAR